MWKVLGAVAAVTVVAILLLQIDDALNPTARALLQHAEQPGESDAFVYLTGIVAAQGEDPARIGRALVDAYRRAEQAPRGAGAPPAYGGYPQERRLPLPQADQDPLFRGQFADNLPGYFADPAPLARAIEEHATLLARYRFFLELRDFRSLTLASVNEPILAYEYVSLGDQLEIFRAVREAQFSPAAAANILADNIAGLRWQLTRADTLIGKMVFGALLARNIDALWLLVDTQPTVSETRLKALAGQELSLANAYARELAMSQNAVGDAQLLPPFLDREHKATGWLAQMVYKPNMTTNALANVYGHWIELSQTDARAFATALETQDRPHLSANKLRNFVGSILMEIAIPGFEDHVGRLHDLNAKIVLFNTAAKAKQAGQTLNPDQIENPYYGTDHRASYTSDRKHVCFDGPLPDERKLRCLRVRL